MKKEAENIWLTSRETMKELKISDCDLAHFRIAGKLEFKKERNAYFYSKKSILKLIILK
ncbi:MAG: hypothetical protein K0R26_1972 [Bacteroidota bacterium]|jgi:hypothetical protein|nr:hypothetical protein [Bacteroidota bacterium]